jgi:hypothetical protein
MVSDAIESVVLVVKNRNCRRSNYIPAEGEGKNDESGSGI